MKRKNPKGYIIILLIGISSITILPPIMMGILSLSTYISSFLLEEKKYFIAELGMHIKTRYKAKDGFGTILLSPDSTFRTHTDTIYVRNNIEKYHPILTIETDQEHEGQQLHLYVVDKDHLIQNINSSYYHYTMVRLIGDTLTFRFKNSSYKWIENTRRTDSTTYKKNTLFIKIGHGFKQVTWGRY